MPEPRGRPLRPSDPSVPQTAALETMERPVAAKSRPGTPSTLRLVIRVRITPEGQPRAPVRGRLGRGALPLILGVVAVLLAWVGISVFRTGPTSAPIATEGAPNAKSQPPAPSEAAPVVSGEPLPKPTAATAQTRSVELEAREQPEASTSPTHEAIPIVPRSALQTIRGTVRVSVRVIVGKDGTVVGATADHPGPSRYFERLAIEAARKWTFTRADSAAQRSMVVTFNFTRAGITARANSLQ